MSFERLLLAVLFAAHTMPVVAQHLASGDNRRFYPDDPLREDPDRMDIPEVAEFELFKDYDFIENTFSHPAKFDGPAANVNTLDEVPDSSWFTNRLGRHPMTVEEIVRGPDTTSGPAEGVWSVTGRPWAGITPKFTIRDSRGDTYLIKLDPAHMPELPSSAEIISTKLFHAIGYYVAEYYLVHIDLSRLEVEPGARFKFGNGEWLPIKHSDLEHWLRAQPRLRDGTIRAVASKYVPGKPVGEFRHYGTRSDDPNDIFPHELRRELRGYRVFAAWLNHDDSRALNTFDSFVEVDGRHFIQHYLLDFGSNLGSGSTNPQEPRGGYEYYFETDKALKGMVSFGLWSRDWMEIRYPSYPAVGNFESVMPSSISIPSIRTFRAGASPFGYLCEKSRMMWTSSASNGPAGVPSRHGERFSDRGPGQLQPPDGGNVCPNDWVNRAASPKVLCLPSGSTFSESHSAYARTTRHPRALDTHGRYSERRR